MNGIFLIDKEQDFTSFDVVAIMKGICKTGKVGHMGTLDPMATGVLPIMVGSATKIQKFINSGNKRYRATLRFGISTDTQDIWGNVIATSSVTVDDKDLISVLPEFIGEIDQLPPMYSAVKVGGVRLYKLARQGAEVERQSRRVTVYGIDYLGCDDNGDYMLDITCSEGTYIRTVVSDIGKKLGCPAVMTGLVRTLSNGFKLERCIKIGELKKLKEEDRLTERLITTENIFSVYDSVNVREKQAVRFKNGGGLSFDRLNKKLNENDYYRVYCENVFLGLGLADGDNKELRVCFHNK